MAQGRPWRVLQRVRTGDGPRDILQSHRGAAWCAVCGMLWYLAAVPGGLLLRVIFACAKFTSPFMKREGKMPTLFCFCTKTEVPP